MMATPSSNIVLWKDLSPAHTLACELVNRTEDDQKHAGGRPMADWSFHVPWKPCFKQAFRYLLTQPVLPVSTVYPPTAELQSHIAALSAALKEAKKDDARICRCLLGALLHLSKRPQDNTPCSRLPIEDPTKFIAIGKFVLDCPAALYRAKSYTYLRNLLPAVSAAKRAAVGSKRSTSPASPDRGTKRQKTAPSSSWSEAKPNASATQTTGLLEWNNQFITAWNTYHTIWSPAALAAAAVPAPMAAVAMLHPSAAAMPSYAAQAMKMPAAAAAAAVMPVMPAAAAARIPAISAAAAAAVAALDAAKAAAAALEAAKAAAAAAAAAAVAAAALDAPPTANPVTAIPTAPTAVVAPAAVSAPLTVLVPEKMFPPLTVLTPATQKWLDANLISPEPVMSLTPLPVMSLTPLPVMSVTPLSTLLKMPSGRSSSAFDFDCGGHGSAAAVDPSADYEFVPQTDSSDNLTPTTPRV